jgi:hypothetical protein
VQPRRKEDVQQIISRSLFSSDACGHRLQQCARGTGEQGLFRLHVAGIFWRSSKLYRFAAAAREGRISSIPRASSVQCHRP